MSSTIDNTTNTCYNYTYDGYDNVIGESRNDDKVFKEFEYDSENSQSCMIAGAIA